MAETVKSALFIDYDSLRERLAESRPEAAARLASRWSVWIGEIESGKLIAQKGQSTRRRVVHRRCYAGPGLLDDERTALIAGGFEIAERPENRGRSAADIQLALDVADAVDAPAAYDEFIILAGDTDITPLVARLRGRSKSIVVYDTGVSGAGQKAGATGVIPERALFVLVAGDSAAAARPRPTPAPPPPAPPVQVAATQAAGSTFGDRNEIEALARKVSAATNVPLLSPRVYADLFRYIAQEVAEKGYHFQKTAEDVTEKLVASGRNVNRRQVVFVVKGLALKGHVFSTSDTPERLAEVFREQVIYLIGNSDVHLDGREQKLLSSWIVGRVAGPAPAAPPSATPAVVTPAAVAPPPPAPPAIIVPPPPPAVAAPAPLVRVPAEKATPKVEKPAPAAAEKAPVATRPAAEEARPTRRRAQVKPAPAREALPTPEEPAPPIAAPSPATASDDELADDWLTDDAEEAPVAAAPPPPPAPPAEKEPEAKPSATRRLDEIRAAAAARLAALGKGTAATLGRSGTRQKTAATPPPPPAAKAAPEPKPAIPPRRLPPPQTAPAAEPAKDQLESSILAAIAQAVDVLVEDGGGAAKKSAPSDELELDLTPEPAEAVEEAEAFEANPPEPDPSEGEDSDDIGDEIQKIIASYSRARQQGESR